MTTTKSPRPASKPKLPEPRYLGDSVYASFDGYHIWLRTGSHDSDENKIALEPSVFGALVRYQSDIEAEPQ